MLSALMLAPFHLSVPAGVSSWREVSKLADWHGSGALLVLRGFSAVIGLLHIGLIFLCLRRVFPGRPGKQTVGLLLAAFVPAHLYMSHHVTNEPLAALFVTGAVYFCLRGCSASVGICLGLAMLTKFSALLAIPPILGALLWNGVRRQGTGERRQNHASRFAFHAARPVLLALAAFLLVCGWHYGRVWLHFGKPLVGNWDASLPIVWWQEPGYRTSGWCWHFGETFVRPVFSGLFGHDVPATMEL
ncbi:MAG: hypothetical protein DME25_13275 [Verrucomicrobia bacterium]|nr:MAG: hypothetical protein DME25_13275 [Verrucomicrobiota bacterium]